MTGRKAEMAQTEIAWTDTCWNVVKGCKRVSPGCGGGLKGPDGGLGGCYAETMAARLVRMGGYEWGKFENDGWQEDPQKKWTTASRATADKYKDLVRINKHGKAQWTGVFAFDAEKLREPLSWRARRLVFANSMSDLFGEGLSNEQIAVVFGVMAACPRHTFQVLTKRAERMPEWFEWMAVRGPLERLHRALDARGRALPADTTWPLPNVWLGVSCERQEEADERIPLLLKCPAAVRWASAEPLLGRVNFRMIGSDGQRAYDALTGHARGDDGTALDAGGGERLDWIVWGGESGNGARPCNVDWIRRGVEDCQETGVPAFVKQLGAYPREFNFDMGSEYGGADSSGFYRADLKDKKGADPLEWPEDLRVRAWPRGLVPPKKKSLPVVGGGQ